MPSNWKQIESSFFPSTSLTLRSLSATRFGTKCSDNSSMAYLFFSLSLHFPLSVRGFLQGAGHSLHILLIQMDLEESHCNAELIASAK